MCAEPKSAKRYLLLDLIFTISGSLQVKAVQKNADEIDTWFRFSDANVQDGGTEASRRFAPTTTTNRLAGR